MKTARRKQKNSTFRYKRLLVFSFGALLFVFVVTYAAVWGWYYIQKPSAFPIRHIVVQGDTQHVDVNDVTNLVRNTIHGGFFSLQLSDVKQLILKNAWLTNVALSRVWPDTLVVDLSEQKAVARWGQRGVVNQQGQVFYPDVKTIDKNLPKLSGADDKVTDVFDVMKEFNQALQPLALSVAGLELSSDNSWTVMLSNGVLLSLGQKQYAQRFERLVRVYKQLVAHESRDIVKIDCRYQNGFAVLYK